MAAFDPLQTLGPVGMFRFMALSYSGILEVPGAPPEVEDRAFRVFAECLEQRFDRLEINGHSARAEVSGLKAWMFGVLPPHPLIGLDNVTLILKSAGPSATLTYRFGLTGMVVNVAVVGALLSLAFYLEGFTPLVAGFTGFGMMCFAATLGLIRVDYVLPRWLKEQWVAALTSQQWLMSAFHPLRTLARFLCWADAGRGER
ncbi:MAG: hypothetical protein V4513_03490 [Pseudomonadota bacterium]